MFCCNPDVKKILVINSRIAQKQNCLGIRKFAGQTHLRREHDICLRRRTPLSETS
jgi:hypothetical protein